MVHSAAKGKRINKNDIPLGATALNGKTVGFDPVKRKRVWVSGARRKRSYVYIPDPAVNPKMSMRGWLLTIMRKKPVRPGFHYARLVPTERERDYLNAIKRRVDQHYASQGKPRSAAKLFRLGGRKFADMAALAANYK